jgi:predicted Fe-Mo cluster-binding NifX family protein
LEIWQMRIVVSSQGENLEAQASPVFGRCPSYVFVDSETMAFEALPNPAMNQGGGAGIQAAQFVVNWGAQVVLSGSLGPNAFDVLQAAGVPGYLISGGTVREAVEAYKSGHLQAMGGANVAAHAGMGRSGVQAVAPQSQSTAAREAEMAELRDTLKSLRQQLAQTMERIEELEHD